MLDKLKSYLETIHITPINWLVGVSGVLMVRFFLESLSSPTSSGFFSSDSSTLIHYYLLFLSGLLMLMVFFQIVIPSWKKVIPQFIALASPMLFIPPIADWIISRGKGIKMTYLFNTPAEIVSSFLSIFSFKAGVATAGIKIEIILALFLFGILVYFLQRSWKRAILSPLILYVIIFIFASLPGIISAIGQIGRLFPSGPITFFQNSIAGSSTIANNLHGSLQYGSVVRLIEISFNFMLGKILFIISSMLASLWFFINFKDKFKAIFRNFRTERVAHYIFTVFVGIFTAYIVFGQIKFNWNDWLSVIIICLSLCYSGIFAICMNDMADEDIDMVSNTDRPLVTGSLSRGDMKQTAFISLVAALISGFLAGYTAFFLILAFNALYYIYSVPPTRFKLIPFFSSFIIGLCYLTAILAGFFLVSPVKQVSAFPPKLAAAVVVIIVLLSHARDMKDIEGDRIAGVKTVPVIFGDIWGPRVVGFLSSLSYILVPVFLGTHILFISAVPATLANYYFVNKKPYSEKPMFKTYFAFVLASFLLLFL
jgi:4-hydroxybenzoate polyprenyltransferase